MAFDIVIVGFKVKKDNSVFYRKLRNIRLGNFEFLEDDRKLLANFKKAISVSDFVSVRIVNNGEDGG